MERRLILGTAGHIDHGKTALVRALTGVDTDRLPEEKRRGITIDLGFAPLDIDGAGTIGIIDVPGHEGFVRTMLAGASGIDLAMLVIAADEGVMPQTREHLEILSLLGIPKGVVALTKCDLVDDEWLALVKDEAATLVGGTALRGSDVVAVSSVTGAGITELRQAIARAALSVGQRRRADDLFRMPVDRVFSVKGTGTVVTGTVWSGTIARDSVVQIQPEGKSVRVRAIQSHGHTLDSAGPGTRAALALAGCDVTDLGRGSTIVSDTAWLPTRELDASLKFSAHEFRPGPRTRVRLHIGTADTGARFSRLRPGADGDVVSRLVLDHPLIARGGDRLIVRLPSPARTIGGGRVLDPHPPRGKDRVTSATPDSSGHTVHGGLARMLETSGVNGIAIRAIPIRTGLVPSDVDSALRDAGTIIVGERAWALRIVHELEAGIRSFIAIEMANHPLEAGVSLQTVRSSSKAPAAVMDLSLDRLVKGREIELDGSVVRPGGWDSRLGKHEQALSDAILHEICIHGAEPPGVAELSERFGVSAAALMRRLEREGRLDRISDERYYARETVEQMVATLRSKLESGRIYSPGELREVLGVSRKYLIPFLEFCDRSGVTERREAGRTVRQVPAGA